MATRSSSGGNSSGLETMMVELEVTEDDLDDVVVEQEDVENIP